MYCSLISRNMKWSFWQNNISHSRVAINKITQTYIIS